jgi:hypothetical protein
MLHVVVASYARRRMNAGNFPHNIAGHLVHPGGGCPRGVLRPGASMVLVASREVNDAQPHQLTAITRWLHPLLQRPLRVVQMPA